MVTSGGGIIWQLEVHGNLRWSGHDLTSRSLTLTVHLITAVHLNQSWSLELKRRRGFMSRPYLSEEEALHH